MKEIATVCEKIRRSVAHRLLLALFVLGLLVIGRATAGQSGWEQLLGEPPTWPERPGAAVTAEEGDHLAYLPLVQRPSVAAPWVNTQNREASRTLYLVDDQSSAGIDSGWTGEHATCSGGSTTEAFRLAMLRRINYFRSMAGIPAVTGFDATYTAKAQAAALMMSVNRALSHDPPPGWVCYTEAGDEGAGSSNLYLGVYGPDAISGYIRDPGAGNTAVGHRRWILYPQTQWMGTGDIPPRDGYPAANALWVFDQDHMWGARPETREAYVAWPPPGYVPYPVVYPRWSFAYAGANFGQATVSMTRGGQALAVQVHTPVNGYGENTLVWEPQTSFGSAPPADTSYLVTVSDVEIGGETRDFTYTVIVFDPSS
jgi:uncharacterized protein YkwD